MHPSWKNLVAVAVLTSLGTAQQIDWIQNPANGRWYGATFATTTWTEGQALAVSLGGNLTTIRSAAEQAWIQANFGGYLPTNGLWIGFNDVAVEGQWVWASGEPATYTNWGPGEPNNGGGIEDWGLLMGAVAIWRWNDAVATGSGARPLLEVAQRPARSWSWPGFTSNGTRPAYGCVADVDGDEDLDYLSPNRDSGTITVHANNGAGSFTLAQTISGCGTVHTVQAFDLNGDGRVDLVATDNNGRVLSMLQNTAGGFAGPVQLAAVPAAHGLSVADLNGDGRFDLVVTSLGSDDRVRILLAQANGAFTVSANYGPLLDDPYQPTLADLDGDGIPDLVVAGSGNGVALLRGTGGGNFAFVSNLASSICLRVATADLDNDGDRDLVVPMVDLDAVQVWRNQGNFSFQLVQTLLCGDGPHWATTADLDDDGDQDVVVPSHLSDTVHVLRNDGTGTLAQEAVLTGQDYALWTGAADLDNDGDLDLLTSNHFGNNFSVHRQVRNATLGTSAPVTWATTPANNPPFGARHSQAAASRPGEILVFGGFDTAPRNDTWTFDGTAWSKEWALANPAVRYDHALAHDSQRNETLLFGGRSLVFPAMPDTWVWDGFDWIRRYPLQSPAARFGHRLAYDAARQRVVLFGGRNATTVFGDTWTWDGFAWTEQSAVGPTPRFDHVLVNDSERQRVVLIGGDSGSGLLGDVSEWNGSAWTPRTGLTGSPGAFADAAACWDATARRVLVHGGRRSDGLANTLFAYDGRGFVRIAPTSGAPAGRDGHVLAQVGGLAPVHLLGGAASAPLYGAQWSTTLPPFGRFERYGAGCLGSGGVPSLRVVEPPVIGRDFVVAIDQAPVNFALGVGVLGYSRTFWGGFPLPAPLNFLGMPGCVLHAEPATFWPFAGSQTNAQWAYTIPASTQLVGAEFYIQALLVDPLVPNPANTFLAVMTDAMSGVAGY
jgi:hypothetical protein